MGGCLMPRTRHPGSLLPRRRRSRHQLTMQNQSRYTFQDTGAQATAIEQHPLTQLEISVTLFLARRMRAFGNRAHAKGIAIDHVRIRASLGDTFLIGSPLLHAITCCSPFDPVPIRAAHG